jgi:hypothetical protein
VHELPPAIQQCEACGRDCPVDIEHVQYDRASGKRIASLYFCSGTCWRFWCRRIAQLPAKPLTVGTLVRIGGE